jgi:hypothetical protein
MKLIVRGLAVCFVVVGFAAASLSSSSSHTLASHQSATAALPIPVCGPGIPTCGTSNLNIVR